jgi:hypothetical protein
MPCYARSTLASEAAHLGFDARGQRWTHTERSGMTESHTLGLSRYMAERGWHASAAMFPVTLSGRELSHQLIGADVNGVQYVR